MMRRSACGGCKIEVNGMAVTARTSGALWIGSAGVLAAGDLHFEKGSSYGARNGQLLPPYDSIATIGRLETEVAALDPRVLVLMGDSFHDERAEGRLSAEAAWRIAALAEGREMVWLVGNHDVEGPRGLPGVVVEDLIVGSLTLTHEPTPGPAPGEAAGHLHPVATVAGYGQRVRRRCFLTDGSRIILPAFGAYAGGLNVRDTAFAGLFQRPPTALILGEEKIHAVEWARLADGR